MMFAAIRIAGIVARMALSRLVACLRRLTGWLALLWRLLRRPTRLRLIHLSVLLWRFLVILRSLLLSRIMTLTLVLFLPSLSVLARPDKQLE